MFQGRSFNRLQDFSVAELRYLIDFARHLKRLKAEHIPHRYLEGQNIALIFDKTSTRTRSAFTVAALDLGAHVDYLGKQDIQFGMKETAEDTAKVLGRMYDGIGMRVSKQSVIDTFVSESGVQIWNGMSDEWHPTQMLADFMTILEHFGTFKDRHLVFVGDGRNNIAHSLLMMGGMLGVSVTICSPSELQPAPEVLAEAQRYGESSGAVCRWTDSIDEAVRDADIVYTDVWASMGEESELAERIRLLKPYQMNQALVDQITRPYIVMHCLPACHNADTDLGRAVQEQFHLEAMEITDEVFSSEQSVVFQQAENRLHTIKAVLAATAGNLYIPILCLDESK